MGRCLNRYRVQQWRHSQPRSRPARERLETKMESVSSTPPVLDGFRTCGNTHYNLVVTNVGDDYSPCRDEGAVANGHLVYDSGADANYDVRTNGGLPADSAPGADGRKCTNAHIMAEKSSYIHHYVACDPDSPVEGSQWSDRRAHSDLGGIRDPCSAGLQGHKISVHPSSDKSSTSFGRPHCRNDGQFGEFSQVVIEREDRSSVFLGPTVVVRGRLLDKELCDDAHLTEVAT